MTGSRLVGSLLLCLALTGCATAPSTPGTVSPSTQIILAAGATLDAVGQTYAQTYDLYNAAYLAKKIPEADYRHFVSWASDFQIAYPLAVEAFKSATTATDRSAALDRALALKTQLLNYYIGIGGTP